MPRYHCTITTLMWDTVDRISHHIDIEYSLNAASEEEAIHACKETFDPVIKIRCRTTSEQE